MSKQFSIFNFCYIDIYFAHTSILIFILILSKNYFLSYFSVLSRCLSRFVFVLPVHISALFPDILSLSFPLAFRSRSELKADISVRSRRKRITSIPFAFAAFPASSYRDAAQIRICDSLSKHFKRNRVHTPTCITHAPVYGRAYVRIYR